ncbi:uncharacterized protein LOC111138234 [Crassostrea virginica]
MYVPDPAEFVEISASETSRPTNLGLHDSKANQKNNMTVDDHMYVRSVHMATCSVSTQTNGMSDIGDSIVEDRGSTKRRLLMEDVLKNDKSCKFYTGLYLAVYTIIFNVLSLKASSMVYWNSSETNERQDSKIPRRGPKRLLSLKEEFTLTLLRLRRGFDTKSLGDMFGVSESSVCRIFTTWVCLMIIDLSFLIKWPTREQIRENLPKCFKYFKKTRCVIDCTEFFVQKPSLPSAQRKTYSSYKHCVRNAVQP